MMIMPIVMKINQMVKREEKKLKTSELNYLKKILEDRKIQILKNINSVHTELYQLGSCKLNDEGDQATINNNSRVDDLIVRKQQQELKNINIALGKVKSGEYGTCAMCGIDIGLERLKVKPHAIYCIACREISERT